MFVRRLNKFDGECYIMNENVVIEDQKLNRIVKRIIQLENENVKTREYNDEDIKKKIEKIIEEEIKCC